MKKTTKKFISILLVLMLTIPLFSVGISAYNYGYIPPFGESCCVDNLWFDLSYSCNQAYFIGVDSEDNLNSHLTIPATVNIDGEIYTVTRILDCALSAESGVEEITLPSTINYIGDEAFCDAPEVKKINIPDDCIFDYVGDYAFGGTAALDYLEENAKDGNVILGQNALYCYRGNAENYVLPEEITFIACEAFAHSSFRTITLNDKVTSIANHTFIYCPNLKEIRNTDSVKYIEDKAFMYCSNLKEISSLENLYSIGERAFFGCSSLREIELGDSLLVIGPYAFSGTEIEELYIGENLSYLYGAFAGCSELESFTVSPYNKHYFTDGTSLYYASTGVNTLGTTYNDFNLVCFAPAEKAPSLTVDKNVNFIYHYAFYNHDNIGEIILPDSEILIGEYAFAHSSVKSINLENVTSISCNAFEWCENLEFVNLSKVEFIEASAFENCRGLKGITLSDEIEYIGSYAFCRCTSLSTIRFPNKHIEICEDAFYDCDNITFEVYEGSSAHSYAVENGIDYVIIKDSIFDCIERFFMQIIEFLISLLPKIPEF